MSKEIKDFISSIDNSLYNKIRQSKSDAECRRYLREHLEAINYTHCCRQLFKLRDNCVNGVDDEVCKNSGICKYCS